MGHAARTGTRLRREGRLIKLGITYTPETGGISVSGPIEHKEGCLEILDKAKDAVLEYHQKKLEELTRQAKESPVIPAHIGKRI